MNRLSTSIFAILIVGLFWFAPISGGQEQKSGVESVLNRFPGYHLLTLEERDPDARAFIQKHFPKANTSLVHADFDGDGQLDYALLLRSDKSEAAKLVVLLCSEDTHCRNVFELDISGYSGSAYLQRVAKSSRVSQTKSIDTKTAPVNLEFNGIRVTYFGKGEVVLYWDKKLKKIEEVQTED